MSEDNALEYIRLSPSSDISDIIALHQEAFKHHMFGQVGEEFLRYYYHKLLHFSSGAIFVCFCEGKIVGFLAGIADEKGFYDLRFYFMFMKGVFCQLFRNSRVFMNVIRTIRRKVSFQDRQYHSELLAIAVSSNFQRQGVGRKLIELFEMFVREQGKKGYRVLTETRYNSGQKLYDALGFHLVKEVGMLGMFVRMYTRKIQEAT